MNYAFLNENIIIPFGHVLPEMISGHLAAPYIKCFQDFHLLKIPVNGSFFKESLLEISGSQIIFQMKLEISLISCS